MVVTLEEAKGYLRVDSSDDDGFIQSLILTAEQLVADISRIPKESLIKHGDVVKIAELYAIAYLYEHREEADHRGLMFTLRNLMFGIRGEVF